MAEATAEATAVAAATRPTAEVTEEEVTLAEAAAKAMVEVKAVAAVLKGKR